MTAPRVRFAPSPTGDLHVGSVRAGLYNYLYARAKGGTFILRIEDTDRQRSTAESTQVILDGMGWLGMTPDEEPAFQSERGDLYRAKLDELLENGHAYRCYCTREHLAERRKYHEDNKLNYRYERTCIDLDGPPAPDAPFVLRAKIPTEGEVAVDDVIRGRVTWAADQYDDFILARSDGSPVYNFVVVVDDIDMGITHVIRGDDHLNNTPKQAHLYHLLGAPLPAFAHLPMVHGPDGKKLGKRHGATSILEFKKMGFLPETMLSFLARLGWSHGDQEVFTLEELETLFDLADCNASAGIFDIQKLEWQNGMRIRELAPMELLDRARPFIEARGHDPDEPWLPRAVVVIQERSRTLVELAARLEPFYDRALTVQFDEKAKAWEAAFRTKPVAKAIQAGLKYQQLAALIGRRASYTNLKYLKAFADEQGESFYGKEAKKLLARNGK